MLFIQILMELTFFLALIPTTCHSMKRPLKYAVPDIGLQAILLHHCQQRQGLLALLVLHRR